MLCRGTVNILSDDVVVVTWLHRARMLALCFDNLTGASRHQKTGSA